MAEFASLDAYLQFAERVKATAKSCVGDRPWLSHGGQDEDTREFLRVVRETSAARCRRLPKGRLFFRAQSARGYRTEWVRIRGDRDDEGFVDEIETACAAERMLPDPSKVGEGRANRKGIPCLYLATNRETAMAEMRPWVGSRVTVATFEMTRDCRVIDCSGDAKESWCYQPIDPGLGVLDAPTREAGVWGDIGEAFSKPVASQEIVEYVPTNCSLKNSSTMAMMA